MRNLNAMAAIGVVPTFVCARGAALAEPQAGAVLALYGHCFGETDGRRTPLSLGDPVYTSEIIDVGPGAKLRLRMNDGSIISMASRTHLTIRHYRVGSRAERHEAVLSLAKGLLRAEVADFSGSLRFEVQTATGVAGVRAWKRVEIPFQEHGPGPNSTMSSGALIWTQHRGENTAQNGLRAGCRNHR